jgi:hypothetical protein
MANPTTKPAGWTKKKTISISGRGPLLSRADLAENNKRTQTKRQDRVADPRQSAAPARRTNRRRSSEGAIGAAMSGVVDVGRGTSRSSKPSASVARKSVGKGRK